MMDKPAESAVERYEEYADVPDSHYLPPLTLKHLADAAIAELKAENEALRREATDLLDAVYQTVMPEEGDRIVREAFCYSEPTWVEAWMREHPTEEEAKAKLAAAEEIAAGQRQAYIDTKIALAEAERFINRFIIHDGEAKPYSVREGQAMLEQAEDLNRRAADLLRDACLRYDGPQDDGLHRAVDKWLDEFKGGRLP